jgi:phosphatidylinositol 3,5-bisphosphate 5-phosphatase
VWNSFLLAPFEQALGGATDWSTRLIHGFVEQTRCSVWGRELTLTLISRRSRYFAGTRYLKRGINDSGHVANDVETEQILHDRTTGDPVEGAFTSHVQLRASIPLFWTQESNAMIAKPAIVVQKTDPLHITTRMHFQDLFARYGSPVRT